MLRDLAALRWLEAGESVILYDPVAVGKTHVAQALGHQVARRGGDIRFVKCSRMLADLAGDTLIAPSASACANTPAPLVLIVDDFAMREHIPDPKRRPLRPGLRPRHRRQTAHPDQQPGPEGLVSAISEPCRRRVAARPTHQHQPTSPHGRPVQPAPETTRRRHHLTPTASPATLTPE
jgi:hypothetical protein